MAVFIHSLLIYYAIVGEHRERVFRLPLQKLGILARVFCWWREDTLSYLAREHI